MSPVTYHVSHVTCHMSLVTCHLSLFNCHLSPILWLELTPRSFVPMATLKSKVLPIQLAQTTASSQKCSLYRLVNIISGCCFQLNSVTNTFDSNSHLNHTVNIQSGLGFARVVGKKYFNILWKVNHKISWSGKDYTYMKQFEPLDPIVNWYCVIFKQYFMKFCDKGFTLEKMYSWWL